MESKFSDPRLEEHVSGFAEKPAAKFGSQHAINALADELRDKLSQLLKRVQAIEEKLADAIPK